MLNKYHHNILLFALIVVFSMGFVSLISQDAFAASPISTAVANDPDDGDTVYSVGDTIVITFPGATNATASGTMSNTEFRANFTVATTDIDTADTVTGTWDGTSTILTLVINTIVGVDPPTVNTDTVNYDVANGNLFYSVNATAGGAGTEFLGTTVTLTGDFGLFVTATVTNNSGGCSGDCEEPTLGVNNDGRRLVDNGFTYNGKSIDVERFFTPYPLVTVQVGKQNVAEFKIYDNSGLDKISHFELAFGLANGEILSDSKAVINWDKSFDGVEEVSVDDPEHVLDDITITTSEGNCSEESKQQCLLVKVVHTFRAPLDFDILGTNVWDAKHNAWQNYYNHGIEVVGESLNPPKEYDGINKGHIYHLTETGKISAVDEFGNSWSLKYGQWVMDYILPDKVQDPPTMVMTRTHSDFAEYKTNNADNAVPHLLELCPSCLKQYDDLNDSFNHDYPKRLDKMSNPAIQKLMSEEELKAKKYLMQVFEQIYPSKVFD